MSQNPFFAVERERLNRADGTDVKYDALYRKKDGQQLSVVSRSYGLVTHREAVDFAHRLINEAGLNYEGPEYQTASNGAKLFARYTFPDYKFNAAKDTGVENTALDGSRKVDDIIPEITIKNSYDGTSTLDFDGGGKRLVCLNGLMVSENVSRLRIQHTGNVQLERYAPAFLDTIVSVVNGIKDNYERLNRESGEAYAKMLFYDAWVSYRYQKLVLESLQDYLEVTYDRDEEGHRYASHVEVKQAFSAYMLYCVLTQIATHRARTVMSSRRMHQSIAAHFLQ